MKTLKIIIISITFIIIPLFSNNKSISKKIRLLLPKSIQLNLIKYRLLTRVILIAWAINSSLVMFKREWVKEGKTLETKKENFGNIIFLFIETHTLAL